MGAILCIMGEKLCQELQGSTLEYQGNKQKMQGDTLGYEGYDQEYQDYINTFYKQGVFDYDAYLREEEIPYPFVNMKKESGKIYLKSLTKISDWALENCTDDQLPKAIELKNKIETVHLSCQEENYDQHDYPVLIGSYRRDLNTLLSN